MEELTRLRLEVTQWERVCIPSANNAAERSPEDGAPCGEPADEECEARTLYLPPSEPLSEMHLAREFLVKEHGWKEAPTSDRAAFVMAVGDAPPEKRTCGESLGEDTTRIPGPFGRELEVCQKHKLFARMADYLARPGSAAPSPDDLAAAFPWLPRTYLLDRPEHASSIEAALPCEGPQSSYIVKGDAHGGRAVWLPNTYEELRLLVGLPCNAATDAAAAPVVEHRPRLVQEVVKSVLWDGASLMARVFMVVLRRGRTRLSADRGRWSLGLRPPSYELHVFDEALFTQYPGSVRDSAAEEAVIRRNSSEFEAFVQAEMARRGEPRPVDWVRNVFMKEARKIATEAFAASAAPWPWDLAASDAADSLKAGALEPDGAFLFLAQELLLDAELRVRLIEFTCVPADIHGLQAHFQALPWTRAFAQDLGAQLAHLLLRSSGQGIDGAGGGAAGGSRRWEKVAERGPFPHP